MDSIDCAKQRIREIIADSGVPEDPRHAENTLKKLGVNQIYNESSKTANPLYTKLSPSLPHRFSAEILSNKIILTCQPLRSSDSKKIIKYRNVVY
jgi:hypothetical protein